MILTAADQPDVAPVSDVALPVIIVAGRDKRAVFPKPDRMFGTAGDILDVRPAFHVALPVAVAAGRDDCPVGPQSYREIPTIASFFTRTGADMAVKPSLISIPKA